MSGIGGWSTTSELDFLSRLGTHSDHKLDRAALLSGYLATADQRVAWGSIDREAALAYARKQLEMMG